MAKSLTQIKTELGITDNTTLSDLLTMAESNEVFTQQEINKIKALSVMPLPNKVTNQAEMLKERFTNIVLNDDSSSTHSANIRNVLLTEIVKKINDVLNGILNGSDIDSFEDVETTLLNYYIKSETYSKTEIAELLATKHNVIDNENKLNADYVDDTTSTHKFANQSQLNQIIANQNAISGILDGTTIDSFADVESALSDKEDISNKVTSLSSSSTDTEYPSAKCVYDSIDNVFLTDVEMTTMLSEVFD